MKQLFFLGPGKLRFQDVPKPELGSPRDALVRPIAVARCDLDAAFMAKPMGQGLRGVLASHVCDPVGFAISGKPIYAPPFPVGHECIAEVLSLGEAVRHVQPGQLVVVPFQVACGECSRCRRGFTSRCEASDLPVNNYGFGPGAHRYGGMLTDVVRVPYADFMLVPLPAGVDPVAVASASDNLPDAYRAVVGPLREHPGAPVLIMGGNAQSVGLYAAAMARALGATEVDYCDSDPARLAIAERLGARALEAPRRGRLGRYGALPRKYLIGVDASSDLQGRGLELVLRSLDPGGVCTSVGIYPLHRTPVPLTQMYLNGLTLRTGITNARPLIPHVLSLVAEAKLDLRPINTLVAPWADAPEALTSPTAKVIITR
ncbi:MAG: alcohol dehydrogenase catalytic domain-containing protein [Myxococcales bacterium]